MSTTNTKHAKYTIAQLLRERYGELNIKAGIMDLTIYCGLKNTRTVSDWLKIEAGSSIEINHLVLPSVIRFFNLTHATDIYTKEHKKIINQNSKS